jgi:hypothetical protein
VLHITATLLAIVARLINEADTIARGSTIFLIEVLMAKHHHHRGFVHATRDPIRIVPLKLPDEMLAVTAEAVVAAESPQLSYRGGPLMENVDVFTVFWGDKWKSGANADLAKKINDFFAFIVTSELMDQLGEYTVDKFPIGKGTFHGTTTVTRPALTSSVSDSAIQHMLQQEISSNSEFPQPTPNLLYFVYTQPGVAVVQGGARSCSSFCGYHDNISGQIFYAVMPYPGCSGCTGGLSAFDALTSTSSHELCEAITDPIPGNGWYDDANGEIGDICAWQTRKIGNYTVQLEWSNKANKCV